MKYFFKSLPPTSVTLKLNKIIWCKLVVYPDRRLYHQSQNQKNDVIKKESWGKLSLRSDFSVRLKFYQLFRLNLKTKNKLFIPVLNNIIHANLE